MQAPLRRNDPCPCGSGRRYKDCHGSLAAAPAATDALVQSALAHHRQGRIDAAERGYREVLEREPGNAIATHYLGMVAWQRGDPAEAGRLIEASIAASPAIADFHNNLGLLHRDARRLDDAIACFRRTLAIDPGWNEANNNLGLALEAAGRWEEAIAAYRRAIAADSAFAAARQNLALVLATLGEFREAWAHYRWRLVAQGLGPPPPEANASALPDSLAGRGFALRGEQGIGDVLFFLRFAPALARRGARLAFRGDARLHGMLARTGLFALGLGVEREPAPGLEPLHVGDLPGLLRAEEPSGFPPALPLAPDPARVERARAALDALGPRPWNTLTWRGGVASAGPARTQLKEIALDRLGAALRGTAGTWISVQRLPRAGEREALSAAMGCAVHDASAANDDLEEMLALLALADDYVGVSNANTHLRAGLDKPATVFVPHPAEWRWMALEGASPWFPRMTVVRQSVGGDWPSLPVHRR